MNICISSICCGRCWGRGRGKAPRVQTLGQSIYEQCPSSGHWGQGTEEEEKQQCECCHETKSKAWSWWLRTTSRCVWSGETHWLESEEQQGEWSAARGGSRRRGNSCCDEAKMQYFLLFLRKVNSAGLRKRMQGQQSCKAKWVSWAKTSSGSCQQQVTKWMCSFQKADSWFWWRFLLFLCFPLCSLRH